MDYTAVKAGPQRCVQDFGAFTKKTEQWNMKGDIRERVFVVMMSLCRRAAVLRPRSAFWINVCRHALARSQVRAADDREAQEGFTFTELSGVLLPNMSASLGDFPSVSDRSSMWHSRGVSMCRVKHSFAWSISSAGLVRFVSRAWESPPHVDLVSARSAQPHAAHGFGA